MEKERIEIIYQILINNQEITDETLIKYGLTTDEIDFLIRKRIIEFTNNNSYKLVSTEKFRQYGVKLLLQRKYYEANTCFRKCYQMTPNGRNIATQLLLAEIIKKNYQQAFDIYANLEKINPTKYHKDYNLYLYLLSFVTEIPQEYKSKIKELTKDDILYQGKGIEIENGIRQAITQNKFKYAYQQINRIITRDIQYSVKFELIRALLAQIIELEKQIKKEISYLIKNKQYQEIVYILTKKQAQNKLNKTETYILIITKAIIKIITTKNIPSITENNKYDIYEALIGNDFRLAKSLNEEFLDNANESKETDLVNILLIEINKLILELENTDKIQIDNKNNKEDVSNFNQELKDIEDIAYYISSLNIPLDIARKKIGILPEQILLIKLIYARDFYIEEKYDEGDIIIKEIETSEDISAKVLKILNKVKENRNYYKKELILKQHTKVLSKK